MNLIIRVLVLVAFIGLPRFLFSQFSAEIIAEGGMLNESEDGYLICIPGELRFTATVNYQGIPISNNNSDYLYEWLFSPSTTPITLKSPAKSYTQAGEFDVTLTVTKLSTGEKSVFSKEKFVLALPKPNVDFELVDFEGCVPLPVKLFNKSTLSKTEGASYSWVITGAGSSTKENATINVINKGVYSVALEVTDGYGCVSSKLTASAVIAKGQPNPEFVADTFKSCNGEPLDVKLSATEPSNHRFIWLVEGLDTLYGRNVNVQISNMGYSDVELLVDSGFGCSSRLLKEDYLEILDLGVVINKPDTICNESYFYAGPYNWVEWDMGDSSIEHRRNFPYIYKSGGDFLVKLRAYTNDSLCYQDASKWLFVRYLKAEINLSPANPCVIPVTVVADASSSEVSNNTIFRWSPNFYTGGPIANYNYSSIGKKTIYLNIRDTLTGCTANASAEVFIKPLSIILSHQGNAGCAPFNASFEDKSVLVEDSLLKRTWRIYPIDSVESIIYEDSGIDNINRNFTFNEPGDYVLEITLETASGCVQSKIVEFKIGTPPVIDFYALPSDTCASSVTLVVDSSYVLIDGVKRYDLIEDHYWTHIEGSSAYNPLNLGFDRNGHDTLNGVPEGSEFGSHEMFDIKLKASYNGCSAELEKKNFINRWGPNGSYINYFSPCNSDTLYVVSNMLGWTKRIWRIKDFDSPGKDTSIVEFFPSYKDTVFNGYAVGPLIHSQRLPSSDTLKIYAPNGFNGEVSFSLYNDAFPSMDSCAISKKRAINNRVTAKLDVDSRYCLVKNGKKLNERILSTGITGFNQWVITDPDGIEKVVEYNVTGIRFKPEKAGKHIITVNFDREKECPKSIKYEVDVEVPQIEIEVEDGKLTGCGATMLDLKAKLLTGVNVNNWAWTVKEISDPDNEIIITTYAGPNPPIHYFTENGNYLFQLTAVNDIGCSTATDFGKSVKVSDPKADFVLDQNTYCVGDSIKLTNLSSFVEPMKYRWYLNGILQSTDSLLAYEFIENDSIGIKLIVEGDLCLDSLEIEKVISVDARTDFDFEADKVYANCPPLISNLYPIIYNSANGKLSYEWDLGIDTSYEDSSVAFYEEIGKYDIVLTITSKNGCVDSLRKTDYLEVSGPTADSVKANDYRVCPGDEIKFTVFGAENTTEIDWNFGDGNSLNRVFPDSSILHTYDKSYGDSVVVVAFLKKDGCVNGIALSVKVADVNAEIVELEEDSLCGYPQNLKFLSTNSETDLQALWAVNNKNYATTDSFEIDGPGKHVVYLKLEDVESGCIGTDSTMFFIHELPNLSITPSTILCAGDSIFLELNGAHSYDWDRTDGLVFTASNLSQAYANPMNSTKYVVTGVDSVSGCANQISTTMYRDSSAVDFNLNYNDSCASSLVQIEYPVGGIVGSSFIWTIQLKEKEESFTSLISSYLIEQPDSVEFSLRVWDKDEKCAVESSQLVMVYPLPELIVSDELFLCIGDSVQLNASGASSYTWSPVEGLNNPSLANPFAAPSQSTRYVVEGVDVNNCMASKSVDVSLVPKFIFDPIQLNDTIDVGDFVELQFDVIDAETLAPYDAAVKWNNSYALNCTDCKYNYSQILTTSSYTVEAIDPFSCYPQSFSFEVYVREHYQVDMPTAFTPNGDDNNDVVYLRAKGVKELLEFSIFNRWGELVFQTTDINEGWDGSYKGQIQADDNYVYQARVLYYNGRVESIKGYISLLK